MAIAKTEGIEVLVDAEQIVEIAEEYANAGIQEIRMELDDQAGQPLWNLVDTVRQ